jgi:hypothetical protein
MARNWMTDGGFFCNGPFPSIEDVPLTERGAASRPQHVGATWIRKGCSRTIPGVPRALRISHGETCLRTVLGSHLLMSCLGSSGRETGRPYIPYLRDGWISPRARSREPWIERQATQQSRTTAKRRRGRGRWRGRSGGKGRGSAPQRLLLRCITKRPPARNDRTGSATGVNPCLPGPPYAVSTRSRARASLQRQKCAFEFSATGFDRVGLSRFFLLKYRRDYPFPTFSSSVPRIIAWSILPLDRIIIRIRQFLRDPDTHHNEGVLQ